MLTDSPPILDRDGNVLDFWRFPQWAADGRDNLRDPGVEPFWMRPAEVPKKVAPNDPATPPMPLNRQLLSKAAHPENRLEIKNNSSGDRGFWLDGELHFVPGGAEWLVIGISHSDATQAIESEYFSYSYQTHP